MKLTKTAKAVLNHKVTGNFHGLFPNHYDRAEKKLLSDGFLERYTFMGNVCGEVKKCWGTRPTEKGIKAN